MIGCDATKGEILQMLEPKPSEIATVQQDWHGMNVKLLQIMADYFNGTKPTQTSFIQPHILLTTPAMAQTRLDYLNANGY